MSHELLGITAELRILLAVCVLFVLILGSFAVHAVIDGYLAFKQRPRKPLEYCQHHGFFHRQHGLPLPGTDCKMCPQCWMESMGNVRKVKL